MSLLGCSRGVGEYSPPSQLCNKCGLFERTHHKPRPLTLGEDRGHRARTSRNNSAPQAYGQQMSLPLGLPGTIPGPPPLPQDAYAAHQHSVMQQPPPQNSAPPAPGPAPENGRMAPQANGHHIPPHDGNIDPRVTSLRPQEDSRPQQQQQPARSPQPAVPGSQDLNLDPRLGLDLKQQQRQPVEASIPSLSEMMAQNRERENAAAAAASRSGSTNNSGRASPVTLPPIAVLDERGS